MISTRAARNWININDMLPGKENRKNLLISYKGKGFCDCVEIVIEYFEDAKDFNFEGEYRFIRGGGEIICKVEAWARVIY